MIVYKGEKTGKVIEAGQNLARDRWIQVRELSEWANGWMKARNNK